ncbi:hypothetical protein MRY82_06985 [bacterium]|nr:hypothetical protein [bacterium]
MDFSYIHIIWIVVFTIFLGLLLSVFKHYLFLILFRKNYIFSRKWIDRFAHLSDSQKIEFLRKISIKQLDIDEKASLKQLPKSNHAGLLDLMEETREKLLALDYSTKNLELTFKKELTSIESKLHQPNYLFTIFTINKPMKIIEDSYSELKL